MKNNTYSVYNMVNVSSFLPQELFDEIANYVPQASRLKYIEEAKKKREGIATGELDLAPFL